MPKWPAPGPEGSPFSGTSLPWGPDMTCAWEWGRGPGRPAQRTRGWMEQTRWPSSCGLSRAKTDGSKRPPGGQLGALTPGKLAHPDPTASAEPFPATPAPSRRQRASPHRRHSHSRDSWHQTGAQLGPASGEGQGGIRGGHRSPKGSAARKLQKGPRRTRVHL